MRFPGTILVCVPLDPDSVSYLFAHWNPVHFHWATGMVGISALTDPEINKVCICSLKTQSTEHCQQKRHFSTVLSSVAKSSPLSGIQRHLSKWNHQVEGTWKSDLFLLLASWGRWRLLIFTGCIVKPRPSPLPSPQRAPSLSLVSKWTLTELGAGSRCM